MLKFADYKCSLEDIDDKNLTICKKCLKTFKTKSKLIRHFNSHFNEFRPKFSCKFCSKLFTANDMCLRHQVNCQNKIN
ncbi:hypothetical protein BLA29_014692 [Euroglyphus maynei]|uniref:C2H2-type domain-containing protein n=1 Tax=Euroglyphus maynei TaxID=6958 RepID=A0A1Y3BQJ2_EURMA|nr:hypothetical protein BLA29_014692 [Euroglyphus maynei]